MSTMEEMKKDQAPPQIVKLKIQGARNAVNTLSDQRTHRGVSLICPFPALEVNLPASFSSAKNGEMTNGVIHRIGVEDDPETGLPRLRLSIRSDETRSTVLKAPSTTLIDEATRLSEMDSDDSDEYEVSFDEDESYTIGSPAGEDDPGWVNCDEIPMPEDLKDKLKTRRRYKTIRNAVYLAVFVASLTGGIILERSGAITVDDIRSYVAGLTINTKSSNNALSNKKVDLSLPSPEIEPKMFAEETSAKEIKEEEPIVAPEQEIALLSSKEINPAAEAAALSMAASSETDINAKQNSEPVENEVTIVLPTRWPVEYASGYRIRDPNGVVIDIPGGLVKKEGWLDIADKDPMIRSIKSVQRETGARFIVYVNGDMPRFMTTPKGNGVSLKLYSLDSDPQDSQKIALAE